MKKAAKKTSSKINQLKERQEVAVTSASAPQKPKSIIAPPRTPAPTIADMLTYILSPLLAAPLLPPFDVEVSVGALESGPIVLRVGLFPCGVGEGVEPEGEKKTLGSTLEPLGIEMLVPVGAAVAPEMLRVERGKPAAAHSSSYSVDIIRCELLLVSNQGLWIHLPARAACDCAITEGSGGAKPNIQLRHCWRPVLTVLVHKHALVWHPCPCRQKLTCHGARFI